jgi:hypothetical protein
MASIFVTFGICPLFGFSRMSSESDLYCAFTYFVMLLVAHYGELSMQRVPTSPSCTCALSVLDEQSRWGNSLYLSSVSSAYCQVSLQEYAVSCPVASKQQVAEGQVKAAANGPVLVALLLLD